MMTSATVGLAAVYWLSLGTAGFFAAVACVYAALLVRAVFAVKTPKAALAASPGSH